MPVYQLQHALQGTSGLAEDKFVNTIHFIGLVDPFVVDFAACAEAMRQFYRPTLGQGPANYMSNAANAPGRSIKIYDLSYPKPRTPVFEVVDPAAPWTDSGAQNLPSEVAVCLSYRGEDVSGGIPARRRGRMYIGPLSVQAMTTSPADTPMVITAFAQILGLAIQNLEADLQAANAALVIYSPTNDADGNGSLDAATIPSVWWVDNAFDTQRRRGEAATIRTTGIFAL